MDRTAEEMIKAKGLNAPHVERQDLENEIVEAKYHQFDGTTVTVCLLTLKNGFSVVGESACADPDNFDTEIGRKIARDKATEKIWPLLGFRLRDQITEQHTLLDAGPETGYAQPESLPTRPLGVGDQVNYFEQLAGRESAPMLAMVTELLGNSVVSLTVFAPNGTTHARTPVGLEYPKVADGQKLVIGRYGLR